MNNTYEDRERDRQSGARLAAWEEAKAALRNELALPAQQCRDCGDPIAAERARDYNYRCGSCTAQEIREVEAGVMEEMAVSDAEGSDD